MISSSSKVKLPGVKHKVIGLVSGGKDSCFNLMHCIANGHEVVAIATLVPEEGIDELDSHLYQSVGTHLLPLLAQAMGLPHYSRVIRGKAINQGAEYGSRLTGGEGSGKKGDETEDLLELLQDVLKDHPEATAIASGAILSTYQRLRIEHVASRLGLVSLAYLWQLPQLPLVDTMINSGLEVVLVKVAGVGLGVDVVGKTLAETRPLLARLERKYGSHPAGEGGEYESLTLDTPLFSHRLVLKETEVIITDPEPYPVAYLRVKRAELVEKDNWVRPGVEELRRILGLDVDEEAVEMEGLDESSREVYVRVMEGAPSKTPAGVEKGIRSESGLEDVIADLRLRNDDLKFRKKGRWFVVSVGGRTEGTETVGQELDRAFSTIISTLKENGLSLPLHAAHITLLLSSMSLFPEANKSYIKQFGVSPPSRATVCVPLPSGQRVRLEVTGFDDSPSPPYQSPASNPPQAPSETRGEKPEAKVGGRTALHVQSLSYWAPANIGPYSQAVIVNSRLTMAGQVPLIPTSLTLPVTSSFSSLSPSASFSSRSVSTSTSVTAAASSAHTAARTKGVKQLYSHQSCLALQHVRRVLEVLRSKGNSGGGWVGWMESACFWFVSTPGDRGTAEWVIRRAWEVCAEENEHEKAPVMFVQALELPRESSVEIQVNLHTSRPGASEPSTSTAHSSTSDDSDDDDDDELEGLYNSGMTAEGCYWESCITSGKREQGSRGLIFIDHDTLHKIGNVNRVVDGLEGVLCRSVGVRVYHLPSIPRMDLEKAIHHLWGDIRPCVTFVPVLTVVDRYGRGTAVGIEIFGS